ncbi:MAG: hypothetical protein PHS37_07805 [Candidatus Omnitrophica bacterium]|nr:hypothetical protein [Candidatus Omnitrophota bacterium]
MNHSRGSAVLAGLVVLGIIIVAVIVFVYRSASKESEKIYSGMVDELMKSKDEPKYGYGVQAESEILPNAENLESKKKPKPIVYVTPKLKKKK